MTRKPHLLFFRKSNSFQQNWCWTYSTYPCAVKFFHQTDIDPLFFYCKCARASLKAPEIVCTSRVWWREKYALLHKAKRPSIGCIQNYRVLSFWLDLRWAYFFSSGVCFWFPLTLGKKQNWMLSSIYRTRAVIKSAWLITAHFQGNAANHQRKADIWL